MCATVETVNPSQWADESDGLRQFSAIPVWLEAALDVDQVMAALNHHVPEFASGALTLHNCAIDLLTVVLRCWSKVKPHQLSNAVLLLESQLSASGLLV